MLYNRLLPLLVPAFILGLLEIFLFRPKTIYMVLALICLLIILTIWRFIKSGEPDRREWSFLILPILFLVSSAAYSSILTSRITIQTIFILDAGFLYYYLKYVYYYLIKPVSYKEYIFNNIFSFGNFLTFFYASSAVYGLQSFLDIPVWPLMLVIFSVAGLILYQVVRIDKIDFKEGLIYILIGCLVLTELVWTIFYLPFNYNIMGLALTVCYYVLVRLLRLHFLNSLNKRIVKLYTVSGLIIIFLVLVTARWI